MRRHRRRGVLAVEVPRALASRACAGPPSRARVLLQHEQLAAVPVLMGVGRGAVDVRDARIVGVGVAIDAEQALARLALGHQARGAARTGPCSRPSRWRSGSG